MSNITIKQGESLDITAEYDVDISGATIEFNARLKGESANGIDLDETSDAAQFTVTSTTDLELNLLPADTDITPGAYDFELKVDDGAEGVDITCGVITIEESIS